MYTIGLTHTKYIQNITAYKKMISYSNNKYILQI